MKATPSTRLPAARHTLCLSQDRPSQVVQNMSWNDYTTLDTHSIGNLKYVVLRIIPHEPGNPGEQTVIRWSICVKTSERDLSGTAQPASLPQFDGALPS